MICGNAPAEQSFQVPAHHLRRRRKSRSGSARARCFHCAKRRSSQGFPLLFLSAICRDRRKRPPALIFSSLCQAKHLSCFSPDRQSGYHLNIFGWIFIFRPGAAAFPFLRCALPHCPPEASTSFLRGLRPKTVFIGANFGQTEDKIPIRISIGYPPDRFLSPRRLGQSPKPQQKVRQRQTLPLADVLYSSSCFILCRCARAFSCRRFRL